MNKINAVILAGDNKKEELLEGVTNKALMQIKGKPMVQFVVDALRDSGCIDKISIVGPVEELRAYLDGKVDYYCEGKDHLFDNVSAGMEPFSKDTAVLLVTSDIPMITGEMVADFVRRCHEVGADLCYPIIEKQLNEQHFPGVERTYVKLKEGTYTGGNIIYLNPQAFDRCAEFARKLIDYRKKPWKTGRLLGLKFLVGLFVGMLTIPDIEERFSELLDIRASAIVTPYPEIGNDVDKPSDVEMVSNYFEKIAY